MGSFEILYIFKTKFLKAWKNGLRGIWSAAQESKNHFITKLWGQSSGIMCNSAITCASYWLLILMDAFADAARKAEKELKRIYTQALHISQSALCMENLFRARQHRDEFRNNDPLQPVIKQLGLACSVRPCRLNYFEALYLLTWVSHTLTCWLLNRFQLNVFDVMMWKR